MAEDYSIELALLLALVREPDDIDIFPPSGRYRWGSWPQQKSYDIYPPINRDGWRYGRGRIDTVMDTTFHELFRWLSDPAYRKRYGLDK